MGFVHEEPHLSVGIVVGGRDDVVEIIVNSLEDVAGVPAKVFNKERNRIGHDKGNGKRVAYRKWDVWLEWRHATLYFYRQLLSSGESTGDS